MKTRKKHHPKASVKKAFGYDLLKGESHLKVFEDKGDLLTVSQPLPLVPNVRVPGDMLVTRFRQGNSLVKE